MDVEICSNSLASARNALQGGATRIELCRRLEVGGLTPSYSDILSCADLSGLRIHVLVRPRAGDFCYSPAEVEEMMASVEMCRRMGAAAVVVGFLDSKGHVDVELTRRFVRLAAPMEVTFHRAFDEARQEPLEALRAVCEAGCHRLLTSGQRPTALEGAAVIRQLVEADLPIKILAGSGVTPDNVRQLIEATGVTEVHGSCKTTMHDGTMQTDAALVRRMIGSLTPSPLSERRGE